LSWFPNSRITFGGNKAVGFGAAGHGDDDTVVKLQLLFGFFGKVEVLQKCGSFHGRIVPDGSLPAEAGSPVGEMAVQGGFAGVVLGMDVTRCARTEWRAEIDDRKQLIMLDLGETTSLATYRYGSVTFCNVTFCTPGALGGKRQGRWVNGPGWGHRDRLWD
jgi:hypothetical protein